MKINSLFLKFTGIIFIYLTVVTSCTKVDQIPDNSYYVSKEFTLSLKKVDISGMIDFLAGQIPDANTLKSLVASDVDIYKLVYKTTLNGIEINASGLVCIPATPGDYPVLSFQNGTNTVNDFAPSEFPLNNSYLLVECIASMGYIVVIPDYPGFGESVQVPHPYLISEPTVRSLVDMLFAVKELVISELPGITLKNEYYLLGYSQGGWATLALHKTLELNYSNEFNLIGSACGAGPYNIYLLLQEMVNEITYPMPVYLGYILNAYSAYDQFTNPVSDIFNELYASKLSTLYTGLLTADQINSQLTTTIADLITPEFLSGFESSAAYSSVRDALNNNSVEAWHSYKPVLLLHGGSDTQVNPVSTENMYTDMIQAGTSPDLCKKVIVPGVDHGDGLLPCMIKGLIYLNSLGSTK